jgi:hypothetical protein
MPSVQHNTERYANNRAEVSHEPIRQRERQLRGFKSVAQAQRFWSVQGVIHLFRVGRHLLRSANHRLLPFPACLASSNVRLMKSGCQPQTVSTHSSDPKLTIPNHNFMRFWHWMQAAYAPWTDEKMLVDPLPYLRSGPGTPSTVCRSPWYDKMPAVGDIPIVRRFHSEREDLRFSAG